MNPRILAVVSLLALAIVFASQPPGADAGGRLQVLELSGRVLDKSGQPLSEFDYLEPNIKYRLLEGSRLELASTSGSHTYKLSGPGILVIAKDGRVTLNGRPLAAREAKPLVAQARTPSQAMAGPGAMVMRAKDGVRLKARNPDGGQRSVQLYKGCYALVIGVSDYGQGWPILGNSVSDAKKVASVLRSMGWTVELLLDPDADALRTALLALVTGPGRDKERGVLVWYSGHGHTLAEADGSKLGYLVPKDAPDPDRDEMGFMLKAVSMRFVETIAMRLKAKHVLMLFDSCFSGAIFQTTRAKPSPYIEEMVSSPVRQFITAGNENEKVPDQSIFKTVFLQGIKEGYADRNKDGYVTGQELGAYLQEQVVNYSRKAQHPQYGKINNPKLDKGDFVFALRSPESPPVAPKRSEAAPSAKPVPTEKAAKKPSDSHAPAPPAVATASQDSSREKALASMLAAWQSDWNRHDRNAVLAHYDEDAQITTRTKRGVVTVNKANFANILKKKMPWLASNKYSQSMEDEPNIQVQGDTAKANFFSEINLPGQGKWGQVLDMMQLRFKDGRWLITSYKFEPGRPDRGHGRRGGEF